VSEIGVPYAFADPETGARECPVCAEWIPETYDFTTDTIDGEQVTRNYADHYAREHAAPVLITDIPLPWKHPMGTVVAVEYPEDRPLVVDLVLQSGHRTAETCTATYRQGHAGVWDLARFLAAEG
jgi:hypothetical protein